MRNPIHGQTTFILNQASGDPFGHSWWRRQMETFSAFLAICAIHRLSVNSPRKGQWRGALLFFFDLRLNKRLSKQSWGWWFETPWNQLWRHCNDCFDKRKSIYPYAKLGVSYDFKSDRGIAIFLYNLRSIINAFWIYTNTILLAIRNLSRALLPWCHAPSLYLSWITSNEARQKG